MIVPRSVIHVFKAIDLRIPTKWDGVGRVFTAKEAGREGGGGRDEVHTR